LYENISTRANTSYQTLIDFNQWEPTAFSGDKTGAPDTVFSAAEVNAHVQKSHNKSQERIQNGLRKTIEKDIVCLKCGRMGHRKSYCRSQQPNKNKQFIWKKTPPKSGELQIIETKT
jgi:hypothetical protein